MPVLNFHDLFIGLHYEVRAEDLSSADHQLET